MATPLSSRPDLSSLPIAERQALADELADSVHAEAERTPLTPSQIERVTKTLAALDAGEIVGEPFDIVMKRLRGQ